MKPGRENRHLLCDKDEGPKAAAAALGPARPFCLPNGQSSDERAGGLNVSSELTVYIPALLLLPGEGFFFPVRLIPGTSMLGRSRNGKDIF